MQKKIHKLLKENIEFIRHMSLGARGTWSQKEGKADIISVVQKKHPAGFRLYALRPEPLGQKEKLNPEFIRSVNGQEIYFQNKSYIETSRKMRAGKRPYSVYVYDVEEMAGPSFHPDSAYFRLMIPAPAYSHFQQYFECSYFTNDMVGMSGGLSEVKIKSNTFHVYPIRDNKGYYCCMDSLQPMEKASFTNHCWSISVGLAFILGKLWQNEQYLFSYISADMVSPTAWSYELLRPNIHSIYAATSRTPSTWLKHRNEEISDRYENYVLSVTKDVLSNLCTWIHQRDEHKSSVLLIIEAKPATLLMRSAGFALALENMATLFEEWFPEKVAPIKNKQKANALRKELEAVLKNHENDADFQLSVLSAKINDINKPTNRDRLKIPFQLLGIPLNFSDEQALNYRNAILHGNVLLTSVNKKAFEMQADELAMRLLTLANGLVLKLVGYQGWIINHPKMQEESFGKIIDEEYFRDLGGQTENDAFSIGSIKR